MTTKNIKPLGNRILVKRSEAQTVKGTIILPDNAKEKPKQGVVVAVGPGKADKEGQLHRMELKEGDTVLFTAYAGSEVGADSGYLIMSEEDVLGVLIN